MDTTRYLIVNADDFGQNAGVNRGIWESHEHGIVTSASLMVRWPAAVEAAAYAQAHPSLSVGLHLDLGEWAYRNDGWVPLYEVVLQTDASAVAREIARQLDCFYSLTGRAPTHLDSHQHVHRDGPVRALLLETAHRLEVPLRGCHPAVAYCGDFYGQSGKGQPCPEAIQPDALVKILAELPIGVTELGCHPGLGAAFEAMYRDERPREVETLCHPSVRAALVAHGVRLCSFADLADYFRIALAADGGATPART